MYGEWERTLRLNLCHTPPIIAACTCGVGTFGLIGARLLTPQQLSEYGQAAIGHQHGDEKEQLVVRGRTIAGERGGGGPKEPYGEVL